MTTLEGPHAPALLRQLAHQHRRTDPAAAADFLAKAQALDDELSAKRRAQVRAACVVAAQGAGYKDVTDALVREVDEGRAKGTVSLRSLGSNQAKLFVFRWLENPPV